MIAVGRTSVRATPMDGVNHKNNPYATLLHRLHAVNSSDSPPCLVGVTSCVRGEGVSTVAANLAISAAAESSERGVLLVDANLHHPAIHCWFEIPQEPGVTDAVMRDANWRETLHSTEFSGLDLLAAGGKEGRDSFLPEHEARLTEIASEWRAAYDLVVFDLPAVGDGEMNLPFARLLDGVVMVVEAERVAWQDACRAKELLQQSHLKLLGAVLNKKKGHVPGWLDRIL